MFKVCEKKCDECLFSKDKIVSDARRKEVLASCAKKDKHFICHKHSDVCCRGFFDTQSSTSVQLAKRFEAMGMKIIQWVKGEDVVKIIIKTGADGKQYITFKSANGHIQGDAGEGYNSVGNATRAAKVLKREFASAEIVVEKPKAKGEEA